MTKAQAEMEAIERLKKHCPIGTKIYSLLRHVSKSGMSRSIDFFVHEDNEPYRITYLLVDAMGMKFDPKNGGIKVTGCGMDMGYHIVNNLSYTLYGHKGAGDLMPASWQNKPTKDNFRAGYTFTHGWL